MSTINQKLDDLLDNVIQNSGGLFTESHRYRKSFEKGVYACSFLLPNKRTRANIGVDRELLLVASTFEDQQQRTLKFIRDEIETSSGRLESAIAMVVHLDNDGNDKLSSWGTEAGISIIPLNATTKIASEDDLERRISAHLYSHDPFDVSGPVSSDTAFFGRREAAIDLARQLQTGQIRSCLGIRKIGKTSIINRVLLEIKRSYNCICVMIDCSKDEVFESTAAQLLASLAGSVKAARSDPGNYCSIHVESINPSMVEARALLEAEIRSCDKPLIVIFDEVDYITPGSPTSRHWKTAFNGFWRNLRSIYQECSRVGKTFSLLVGGVSTYWFTVEEIDGVENAALAFVPEEFLSPMPTGASVAMLKRLGRIAGLTITDDAAKYISTSTGNIPFWSRKCASYIHRHVGSDRRPLQVDLESATPMVDKFIEEEGSAIAEVALSHLFRVHPDTAVAAAEVSDRGTTELSQASLRTLRRYGVIGESGNFSGAMIETAYASLMTRRDTNTVEKPEPTRARDSLGDWAEDLSVVNKRRNLLEKRLRNITLNFLRFDALNNKALPSLRENILKVVPEGKRLVLSNLTADEVMERLDWLELTRIILRKWPLFEGIFGDKQKFQQNSDLINQRPDAHAKAFDQADFALYRRALSQIEEGVSKLG